MKKFAINVAMLPPDPVMNLALEWNQMLCKARPANISLGKLQYLPHISMVMGCIREEQLDQANELLQSTAAQHSVLALQVPHIRTVNTASGNWQRYTHRLLLHSSHCSPKMLTKPL